ncbi:MAG: Leucine-rich repeat (LRR) protein [Verrucomicrobiales bacterium]|jgi:Leucine-rich repeat (LRR) protein
MKTDHSQISQLPAMAGCAVSLLFASVVAAQDVIPDSNLNQAIRTALGLTVDDILTSGVLLNLHELHVRASICDDDGCRVSLPVSDLTGLENAENLKVIYLRGGPVDGHTITDLSPIAGLTELNVLRLPNALAGTDDDKIAAAKIIGEFKQLVSLSLEDAGIDERHLTQISGLDKLEKLDIDSNGITDLSPIRGLRKVKELDVDKNPLKSLAPISGFQLLQNLDASPGDVDLQTIPPLRSLRILDIQATNDLAPLARCLKLASLTFLGPIHDLTPLANLPELSALRYRSNTHRHFNGITDHSPLRLTQLDGSNIAWIIEGSQANIFAPGNAALLNQVGLEEGEFTTPLPYDNRDPIPDGRLRGQSMSPGGIFTEGLFDLKGIDNFQATGITATDGWISDLTPLLKTEGIEFLNFSNNYISDLSQLTDLNFTTLILSGNPIDPETIPEAWLSNPSVSIDSYEELDPAQLIHDPALREAIRHNIGAAPDTPIDAEMLKELTWLYAENFRIRSLDGMENAINLRGAALRNNIIKDITPVSGLAALQWLRLSGNPVSRSDDTNIAQLRQRSVRVDTNESGRFLSAITPVDGIVYASGYQLTSVRYLQLFTSLTELFLSDNYLTDLAELQHLEDLERLQIDGNMLYLADDSTNQNAIESLQGRGIDVISQPQDAATLAANTIADSNLQQIISIALGQPFAAPTYSTEQLESITEIDWAILFKFNSMSLEATHSIEKMVNLKSLSLENAGLKDIAFLRNLTSLERLDIDFNQISDLSPLSGLTKLVELDLNENRIESITPLANLTALEELDIDTNRITDIEPLASLSKLRELDLHQNRISSLSPLQGLDLELLNIQLNGLDLEDPAVRSAIAQLQASSVNIGNVLPQLDLQASVSYDRFRGVLVLKWTPLELNIPTMIEEYVDFPSLQTNAVSVLNGVVGREITIEFPAQGKERYYRIRPLGSPHF